MSTMAEYSAASKAYANAIRARKTAETGYEAAHQSLKLTLAAEESARVVMKTTAEGLPSDVP